MGWGSARRRPVRLYLLDVTMPVGDVHRCVAGRCGAPTVDNQTVGRRSVASQESIEGESAAGAAKVAAIHVQDVADAIPGTKLYGALIDQIAGDGESSGR